MPGHVRSLHLKDDERRLVDDKRRLVDDERRLVDDERRLVDDERRLVDDERRLVDDERRLADDERRLVDDERRLADDERRLADDERRLDDDERRLDDDERRLADDERRLDDDERRLDDDGHQLAGGEARRPSARGDRPTYCCGRTRAAPPLTYWPEEEVRPASVQGPHRGRVVLRCPPSYRVRADVISLDVAPLTRAGGGSARTARRRLARRYPEAAHAHAQLGGEEGHHHARAARAHRAGRAARGAQPGT